MVRHHAPGQQVDRMSGQRIAHGTEEQPRIDRVREQRRPQRAAIHDMIDLASGEAARPARHARSRSVQPIAAILTPRR
jgi:hypothetical protein